MTTSRDAAKTNRFPGEVRAGELARIRQLFAAQVTDVNGPMAALLIGDFNTSAGDKSVFAGQLTASDGAEPRELLIDTGFDGQRFSWMDADGESAFGNTGSVSREGDASTDSNRMNFGNLYIEKQIRQQTPMFFAMLGGIERSVTIIRANTDSFFLHGKDGKQEVPKTEVKYCYKAEDLDGIESI